MAVRTKVQTHSRWPNAATVADLPNVSGSPTQDADLEVGDTCCVLATTPTNYECIDATLGTALWATTAEDSVLAADAQARSVVRTIFNATTPVNPGGGAWNVLALNFTQGAPGIFTYNGPTTCLYAIDCRASLSFTGGIVEFRLDLFVNGGQVTPIGATTAPDAVAVGQDILVSRLDFIALAPGDTIEPRISLSPAIIGTLNTEGINLRVWPTRRGVTG